MLLLLLVSSSIIVYFDAVRRNINKGELQNAHVIQVKCRFLTVSDVIIHANHVVVVVVDVAALLLSSLLLLLQSLLLY